MATFLNEEFFSSDLPNELAKLNQELEKLKTTIGSLKSGNIADLNKTLNQLKKTPANEAAADQIKKLEKQVNELTAALKRREAAEKSISSTQKQGKQELSSLEKEYKKLQGIFRQLNTKEYKDAINNNDLLKQRIDSVGRQIKATKTKIDDFRAALRGTASTLNTLNGTYGQAKAKLNVLRKALDDVDISTRKGKKAARNLTREYNELRRSVEKFEKSIGDQRRGVGRYTNALNNMNKGLAKFGLQIQGFLLVGNLIKNSFKTAKDAVIGFEKEIVTLASILGETRDDIKSLESSALDLANTTIFTAKAIAQLQTELAKLGFVESEILNSTKAILNFAVAARQELAPAAKLIGSVIRAFELDTAQTTRVVDSLSKSFTRSALNAEDFTEAIKFVAPIANTANVSIEETASLLGVLADAGLRGSIAGTALKNALVQLSRPGSNAVKFLGIQVDSAFELSRALDALAEKQLTLGEVSRLFDERARPAILTLTQNIDRVRALSLELEQAGGTSEELANKQLDTLDSKFQLLKSNFESFAISVSEKGGILDNFKLSIDAINGALGIFNDELNPKTSTRQKRQDAIGAALEDSKDLETRVKLAEKTIRKFLEQKEKLDEAVAAGDTNLTKIIAEDIKSIPGFSGLQFDEENGLLRLNFEATQKAVENQKKKILSTLKSFDEDAVKAFKVQNPKIEQEIEFLKEKRQKLIEESKVSLSDILNDNIPEESAAAASSIKSLTDEIDELSIKVVENETRFKSSRNIMQEYVDEMNAAAQATRDYEDSLVDLESALTKVDRINFIQAQNQANLSDEILKITTETTNQKLAQLKIDKEKIRAEKSLRVELKSKFGEDIRGVQNTLRASSSKTGLKEGQISSLQSLGSILSDPQIQGLETLDPGIKNRLSSVKDAVIKIAEIEDKANDLSLRERKINLSMMEDLAKRSFDKRALVLREFLGDGKLTEAEANDQSLRSEINFLEDRIEANKAFGGEFLDLQKQLLDKRLELIESNNSKILESFNETFKDINSIVSISDDLLQAAIAPAIKQSQLFRGGGASGRVNDPRELDRQIELAKRQEKLLDSFRKTKTSSVQGQIGSQISSLLGVSSRDGQQTAEDIFGNFIDENKLFDIQGQISSLALTGTDVQRKEAELLIDNINALVSAYGKYGAAVERVAELEFARKMQKLNFEFQAKQAGVFAENLANLERIQGGFLNVPSTILTDYRNLFISAGEFARIIKSGADITDTQARLLQLEQESLITATNKVKIEKEIQRLAEFRLDGSKTNIEILEQEKLVEDLQKEEDIRLRLLDLRKRQEAFDRLNQLLPSGDSPLNTFLQGQSAIDRFFGDVEGDIDKLKESINTAKIDLGIAELTGDDDEIDRITTAIAKLNEELERLQQIAKEKGLKELQNSFKFLNSQLDKPVPQAFLQGLIDRAQVAETRINTLITRLEQTERPDRREEIINEIEALRRKARFEYLIAFTETYRRSFADSGNVAKALGDAAQAVGAIAIQRQAAKGEFYEGGYTGDMGVREEAGTVHGQEFVISAPWTAKLGLKGKSMKDFEKMLDNKVDLTTIYQESAAKIPNLATTNIVQNQIDYEKLSDSIANKIPVPDMKNIGGHIIASKKSAQRSLKTIIKDPSHFPITRHNKI